jgi:hypothetical protein
MVFGIHRHSKRRDRDRYDERYRRSSYLEPVPVAVPVYQSGIPLQRGNSVPTIVQPSFQQPLFQQPSFQALPTRMPYPQAPIAANTLVARPPVYGTGFASANFGSCAPAPVLGACSTGFAATNFGATAILPPTEDWESHESMCAPGMRTSELVETHVHHDHFMQPPPVKDVVVQEHHHHHTEILPPPVHDVVHQEHHHHHQRLLPPERIVERQDVHLDHWNSVQQAPVVNHVTQTLEHYDEC